MKTKTASGLLLALAFALPAQADDFPRLDEALPAQVDVAAIAPVFDFDTDSCLPSAGISRNGDRNGGLKPTGSLTGGCRSGNFMDLSNTVHRHACAVAGGNTYCGHFYALYFEKDQIVGGINSGHRHDWEYAVLWTTNGAITHGSYSAHGNLTTRPVAELPMENGHMKIVYHKDGVGTHAFRFAGQDEVAENPYGSFVTPVITSWYELTGDGWSDEVMRTLLNQYDYGSANLPTNDNHFLSDLNEFRPAGYPVFTEAHVKASNPHGEAQYVQLMNNASGLCMDINGGRMASGINVLQWHCHGDDWQRWSYEADTGFIRSKSDPRFCLDNSGVYGNGANIIIWACTANNDNQRFTLNADGSISVRVQPEQVIDGYGTNAGANVGTWWNWRGTNQRWTLVP